MHSGHYSSVWIHVNVEDWHNIPVMDMHVKLSLALYFRQTQTIQKMTGTGGGKEAKHNNMDLLILILDILGKDNPSAKGLGGDDCFGLRETAVDQQQAQRISIAA